MIRGGLPRKGHGLSLQCAGSEPCVEARGGHNMRFENITGSIAAAAAPYHGDAGAGVPVRPPERSPGEAGRL